MSSTQTFLGGSSCGSFQDYFAQSNAESLEHKSKNPSFHVKAGTPCEKIACNVVKAVKERDVVGGVQVANKCPLYKKKIDVEAVFLSSIIHIRIRKYCEKLLGVMLRDPIPSKKVKTFPQIEKSDVRNRAQYIKDACMVLLEVSSREWKAFCDRTRTVFCEKIEVLYVKVHPLVIRIKECIARTFESSAQKDMRRQSELLAFLTEEAARTEAEKKLLSNLIKDSPQQTIQDVQGIIVKLMADGDEGNLGRLEKFLDKVNEEPLLVVALFKDCSLRKRITDLHAAGSLWKEKEMEERSSTDLYENISLCVRALSKDVRRWKDLEELSNKISLNLQKNVLTLAGSIREKSHTSSLLKEVIESEKRFASDMTFLTDLLTYLKTQTDDAETQNGLKKLLEGIEDHHIFCYLVDYRDSMGKACQNMTGMELLKGLLQGFASPEMQKQLAAITLSTRLYPDKLALLSKGLGSKLHKLMNRCRDAVIVKKFNDRSITLESFLIMPAQRSMRYPLLQAELAKGAHLSEKGFQATEAKKAQTEILALKTATENALKVLQFHAALIDVMQD
jgi:hypothetical protein